MFEAQAEASRVLDGAAKERPIEEVLASIAKKVAIEDIRDGQGHVASDVGMKWDATAITNLMDAIKDHNETAVPLKQVKVQDIRALKGFLEPERQTEQSPAVEKAAMTKPDGLVTGLEAVQSPGVDTSARVPQGRVI